MDQVTLHTNVGREIGSGPARRLRAADNIPGVVYGLGADTISLSVDRRDLRKALTTEAGLNAVLQLEVGDGASELAIVKELQRHPVRRDVTHVDFLRIDINVEVTVEVRVVLTGEAELVENEGGYVDHVLHTLTINAKPNAIPNEIVVDISHLEIGTGVTIGDITLPEGTSTDMDAGDAIAFGQITRAAVEEPEEGLEGEEGEEGAEGEDGETSDSEGDDSGE